jgi:hypothetical protein
VFTTKGTIGYSEQTVIDNAEAWGSKGRLLGFINNLLTPLGVGGGLLLIALGLFLVLGSRNPQVRRAG